MIVSIAHLILTVCYVPHLTCDPVKHAVLHMNIIGKEAKMGPGKMDHQVKACVLKIK